MSNQLNRLRNIERLLKQKIEKERFVDLSKKSVKELQSILDEASDEIDMHKYDGWSIKELQEEMLRMNQINKRRNMQRNRIRV